MKRIPKIETVDFYIENAIHQGKKAQDAIGKCKDSLDRSKRQAGAYTDAMIDAYRKHFRNILTEFPSLDSLTEFYTELIALTLDYAELKKSLGSLAWAIKQLEDFGRMYRRKYYGSLSTADVQKHKKEFLGRSASVPKQIKKNLQYLEAARVIMYDYPSIKTMFSVSICGFPNVGKSTLLSKITPAKPEIGAYEFTTKKINIGYAMIRHQKVQILDTPGTLNRLDRMNMVEKQAYLALKYVANVIVYIFDVTNIHSLDDQRELLERVKRYHKPIIFYLSKTDILTEEQKKQIKFSYVSTPQELLAQIATYMPRKSL